MRRLRRALQPAAATIGATHATANSAAEPSTTTTSTAHAALNAARVLATPSTAADASAIASSAAAAIAPTCYPTLGQSHVRRRHDMGRGADALLRLPSRLV